MGAKMWAESLAARRSMADSLRFVCLKIDSAHQKVLVLDRNERRQQRLRRCRHWRDWNSTSAAFFLWTRLPCAFEVGDTIRRPCKTVFLWNVYILSF